MTGGPLFTRGGTASAHPTEAAPWTILVADDDPLVHDASRVALRRLRFKTRGVRLLAAYSGAEALAVLRATPEIAVVLLDVVMETRDAGLAVARAVREELGNRPVRILLRTGQPGDAPEQSVVIDFDINDYLSKAELTAEKLQTAVITALRGFDDLMALDRHRVGLRRIIESSDSLYQQRSMRALASAVLSQLATFIGAGADGVLCVHREHSAAHGELLVLAAAGGFEHDVEGLGDDARLDDVAIDPPLRALIIEALQSRTNQFSPSHAALYLGEVDDQEFAALVLAPGLSDEIDRTLLELFCSKIMGGLQNLVLWEKLVAANAALERRVQERTSQLEAANRHLERLSSTDFLTGLLNRRRLVALAGQALATARRYRRPLSVAMIDLDFFKSINDRFGHTFGDRVLRRVAATMRDSFRDADILGRWGGEEFIVVMPETGVEGAVQACERLRRMIEGERLTTADGVEVGWTVSVGVAVAAAPAPPDGGIEANDNGSLDQVLDGLIAAADTALYRAKDDGRNRVHLADRPS